MRRACVFDVNETLLDLGALDPHFERVFGDASARGEWFGQLQQSWLVATVTGVYEEFGTIGGTALRMVAGRRGISLPDEEAKNILGAIRELPPHPEVGEALARLREAGFRLATLTNSTQEVAEAQIENSGLGGHFEKVLSADTVKRLKPAPEPYRMAAESIGVEIGQVRLVAAHAWDVAGAMRVGCVAAFVARPGKVLDPLFEPPDVVGANLREVVEAVIEAETPGQSTNDRVCGEGAMVEPARAAEPCRFAAQFPGMPSGIAKESSSVSEDSRCRVEEVTRVVLRPIASPLPLAFLSFGVGCGLQLGLFPQPAMPNVAVLFGGVVLPAMLVAGILAFLSQETWGRRCSA